MGVYADLIFTLCKAEKLFMIESQLKKSVSKIGLKNTKRKYYIYTDKLLSDVNTKTLMA